MVSKIVLEELETRYASALKSRVMVEKSGIMHKALMNETTHLAAQVKKEVKQEQQTSSSSAKASAAETSKHQPLQPQEPPEQPHMQPERVEHISPAAERVESSDSDPQQVQPSSLKPVRLKRQQQKQTCQILSQFNQSIRLAPHHLKHQQ